MALITFTEGSSDVGEGSVTLRESSGSGTDYAPVVRSKEIAIELDISHSGTVTIQAVDVANPDVSLGRATSITSPVTGTRLLMPSSANAIRFDSTAGHGATLNLTTAGIVQFADESLHGQELNVIIGEALDQ